MNTEASKGEQQTVHQILMQNRKMMEIRGVTDVNQFDEQTVVLETSCGTVSIEGVALHIHVLNVEQGLVTMEGKIDSVTYYEQVTSNTNGKNGFFKKLFR